MKTLAAASFLLWLPAPALQDPQPPRLVELERTDGDRMVAEVLRLDGERVRLRMPVLGGAIEATRPLASFTPRSRFRIELAANPPQGFDEHFDMARRAADAGLLSAAGAQARAAATAAEGMPDAEARQAKLRAWGANTLEQWIADAVAAGDAERARRAMTMLTTRLSGQRTDAQLDALASSVEQVEQQQQDARERARTRREVAKDREQVERELTSIRERAERGAAKYREAVRKSSTTAAVKLCEQALGHFREAHAELQQLLERHPDDEQLADDALQLGRRLQDRGVAAALHAAAMLTVQSDYQGAREWVQQVLAFDPGNAEARSMLSTIAVAAASSADDMRWGWTIGDIGRVGDAPRPQDR